MCRMVRVLPRGIPAAFILIAALLPVACGFGGATSAGADTARSRADALETALGAATAPPDSPPTADSLLEQRLERRDLERAQADLAGTRRAVADGAGLTAGSLLSLAVRELEDGLVRSHAGITPEAAATFEDARRASDRWQAGERPAGHDPVALLDRVETESHRLARAIES